MIVVDGMFFTPFTTRPRFTESVSTKNVMFFATSLTLTGAGRLVIGARIAAGGAPVPRRMMRPGPPLVYGSTRHRLEGTRLRSSPFVQVHDESDQHHERRDVVQYVPDADRGTPKRFREPHRNAGDEEDDRADRDRP